MRLFHRSLLIAVLHVVTHPRITLAIAAVALLISGGLAYTRLGISTDQNKLFDPSVQFFRDYLSFVQRFPENDAIYVVVEAKDAKNPPAVERWTAVADAIAERVRGLQQYVKSVDAKVPVGYVGYGPEAITQMHKLFE